MMVLPSKAFFLAPSYRTGGAAFAPTWSSVIRGQYQEKVHPMPTPQHEALVPLFTSTLCLEFELKSLEELSKKFQPRVRS